MTSRLPQASILFSALAIVFVLPDPCIGKCKMEKKGGLFSAESFVDPDDSTRTISVKVEGILDPKVKVTYKKETKDIPYKDYTTAVQNCGFSGIWPNWFTGLAEEAPPTVKQAVNVPIVTASSELDIADLDGDGDVDAIDIRYFQGPEVKLRNADGTFPRTGVVYPSGKGPETLVLADLNKDGRPDILVADSGNFQDDTGKLAVLLGLASGTFAPSTSFPAGVAPRAVAVGDFNGDGNLDAAVASVGSQGAPNLPADDGRVAVLLGNGQGGFGQATFLQAGKEPVSALAADLNKDGKLDVAVANQASDNVSLLFGNGNGTFQAVVNVAVGAQPTFLGSADFNGDGAADLAVLHGKSATISMWKNNGNGTFTANGRYLAGSNITSFAISDSPNDARPTILSPDGTGNRFLILAANLDGTLVAPASYPVGATPSGIAAADFDGNQRLDLAVASGGGLSVILNPRPQQWPQPTPKPAVAGALTHATSVAAGDFTGDGVADLAIANGGVQLLAGNGNGTFRAPTSIAGGSGTGRLKAVDLNGDSRLDLIAVEESGSAGNAAVYLAGAGGTFARTAYPVGRGPRSSTVADFNGDGRLDIAVGNVGDLTSPAGVSLLLSRASGGFAAATTLDAGLSPQTVAAGDLDGDGKMDLAAAGQLTGAPSFFFGLRVMLGNGDGTFHALPDLETNFGPTDIAVHDFNHDGLIDLAIAHCCGATDMSMLLGNGNGTFRTSRFPGGDSTTAIVGADFNQDGAPELATANGPSGARDGVATILDFILYAADHVNAASGSPGAQARDSIVSAYGVMLATETAAAPSPDWPAVLGGTRIRIRDSAGATRDAGLAYSSAGQLNYHIPADAALGDATVTITNANGHKIVDNMTIVRTAPGLFQATAGGLAAGWAVRVKPDGQQLLEPLVQLNNAGQLIAAPIDLSSDADIMVLQLFGTGLRGRLNLSDVRVLVKGIQCNVLYAGAQNQFPGLDQINIELPRSLRGAGVVQVVVEVEGEEANVLQIRIG